MSRTNDPVQSLRNPYIAWVSFGVCENYAAKEVCCRTKLSQLIYLCCCLFGYVALSWSRMLPPRHARSPARSGPTEIRVDGYRCDVGAGVPLSFWEQGRKELDRVNPEVILVSEADRPDDQLNAFDISYNFHYYLTLRSVLRDGDPAIRLREHNAD